MGNKILVKARDVSDVYIFRQNHASWEGKRGEMRVCTKDGRCFRIRQDDVVKLIQNSGVTFLGEQKKVHVHLKVR